MRLDKFLKVSRIIKRRQLAKDIAEAGRVMINDKVAKPSASIVVGDVLTIQFGNKVVKVKVSEILQSTKKEDADKMYVILDEQYLNNK